MFAGLLGSKNGVSHSEQEPGNWPRQMVRSRGHTCLWAASASHSQAQKPILCDSHCFMHLAICGCLPKAFPVVQCSLLRIQPTSGVLTEDMGTVSTLAPQDFRGHLTGDKRQRSPYWKRNLQKKGP